MCGFPSGFHRPLRGSLELTAAHKLGEPHKEGAKGRLEYVDEDHWIAKPETPRIGTGPLVHLPLRGVGLDTSRRESFHGILPASPSLACSLKLIWDADT